MRRRPSRGSPSPTSAGLGPLPLSHPAHLAALSVAVACVLVSVSFALYDADAWEHLLVGRVIWESRSIQVTNVWTWPSYGAPNVNPSWGFSAALWPFWKLGGVAGLFVWRWLTTLAIFGVLFATARRMGARGLSPLLVLVVAALVYRSRSQIRPETLASVWFALTLAVLELRRHGRPASIVWLVPIALAWANTHVSYYLGFVLIGIHIAWGLERPRLALVALACAAVSFANPFGARALARPIEFALFWRNDPLIAGIFELQPLDWRLNWANGLPLLLAGWPLLIAWRARRRGLDRIEATTAAVFTLLALSGARFAATYVLAATPYVARNLSEWSDSREWGLRFLSRPWARSAAVSALLPLACWTAWTRFEPRPAVAFLMDRSPVHACDFIERAGVRGPGLNHFFHGGYLLWRFWPQRDRLPFMDIHPEDTPPDLRKAYLAALNTREGLRALEERNRIEWALFSRRYAERGGPLELFDADPRWALVFLDDVAALYVRRDGPLADVAGRSGYRWLAGGRAKADVMLAVASRDPEVREGMRAELARQAGESPVNFYGRSLQRRLAP